MTSDKPLRCIYVASEVAGFAKTGGLADVAGSLPRALADRGVDCAVFMPLYHGVRTGKVPLERTEIKLEIPVGDRTVSGSLWRTVLPDSNVSVYLVDQPGYFDRDDAKHGRGLYQFTHADGRKSDYHDNCARFVFFCRAVLDAIYLLDFWPDVLHINDWQAGLIPVYLEEIYSKHGAESVRAHYQRIRTLCTIHNLAYQGLFWHLDMPVTGLPWRLFNYEALEFHGRINFLKAGIVFADLINTVSPTYAREIQTPYFGCGLQGVLLQRKDRLSGIVNGADYRVWNPATDHFLAANYDADSMPTGKPLCKMALQQECGLTVSPRMPLVGIVSRLVDQKGLDLITSMAPTMLGRDTQFVVLGEGDSRYHDMLLSLQRRHPGQMHVSLKLDEGLAHRIEAGADIFLMPSQYEPCGLNQLYSLKYGAVPLVRATGGLADTVADATPENLAAGTATGFSFVAYTPATLMGVIDRALSLYRHEPATWQKLQQTGMRQDWSWNRSAAEYERLYRQCRALP
jgi:starch synthase